MFELSAQTRALDAFTPVAAQAADANGITIDTQGYDGVTFVVDVGAEGFTMNTSNYLDLIAQEGDAANLSDAAAVPAGQQIGTWETPASAIFVRLNDPAEAPGVYKFSFVPRKRYCRIVLDFTGTVTGGIPIAAVALLSKARHQPAGVTQTP